MNNAKNKKNDPMDVDPIDDGPAMRSTPVPTLPTALILSDNSVLNEQEAKTAIEMLKSDDLSNRVAAAHRLDSIANILGPERTRNVRRREVLLTSLSFSSYT